MQEESKLGAGFGAALVGCAPRAETIKAPNARYRLECRQRDGTLKWAEDIANLVTTAGKNDLLDKYFKGSSYTAAWFIGLIDASGFTAVAAGDTMASHSGWSESTAYSNASRPALTLGTVSGGSVNNAGSVAAFTINATATIKGAFVVTNSTKGGTTGTLYSAGAFAADRSVANGDTLNVTVTLSAT